MKRSEKDSKFSSHLPGVLQHHRTMLADGVRNRLLYEAIASAVTPETAFLDVGAGTGVWAIAAAKMGAKRVVAIEIEEALIPIIYRHAQENGVAGRIEIIHGRSDDVRMKGRFDVVVSELFGGNALGDESVTSFVDVRKRFLAPNGVLIPQKFAMLAAPARIDPTLADLPAELELNVGFFRELHQNYGRIATMLDRENIEFLADPVPLVELDFRTVQTAPSLANLSARWNLDDIRSVNAIVMFNRSTFTDSIVLDAFHSPSWGVNVNEFTPFDVGAGELQYGVTIDDRSGNWSVGVPSEPSVRPQAFSPVFGFSRIRMAQMITPHKRTTPRKKTKDR